MKYQDLWYKGKLIDNGKRECSARYEIIKSFCSSNFEHRFTVCDIGANMNYFGMRLIEDFGCSVIAFEFHQFEMRKKAIGKVSNLMFVNHKLSIEDLELLIKCCHFDLILALSVLHHLPGRSDKWIQLMRDLSDNVIIEFALEDSGRTIKKIGYTIPKDGILLGYGDSHLMNNFKRPIVLLKK